MKINAVCCFIMLLAPVAAISQALSPITLAPTPSPPPPPATNRIATDDSLDMFPRWHPYVMVDAVMDFPGLITSRILQAGICADDRDVRHFLGWEIADGSPGQKDKVYYYNDAPETRRANGVSAPFLLFEGDVNPFGGSTQPVTDIACGPDNKIHAVWTAFMKNANGEILSEDIIYASKNINGWVTSNISSAALPSTIPCNGTTILDIVERFSQPQVAVDKLGVVHVIAKYFKTEASFFPPPGCIVDIIQNNELSCGV